MPTTKEQVFYYTSKILYVNDPDNIYDLKFSNNCNYVFHKAVNVEYYYRYSSYSGSKHYFGMCVFNDCVLMIETEDMHKYKEYRVYNSFDKKQVKDIVGALDSCGYRTTHPTSIKVEEVYIAKTCEICGKQEEKKGDVNKSPYRNNKWCCSFCF